MIAVLLGETFIYGLDQPTARLLMTACGNIGVDRQVVRTTDIGFIVPNEVADEYERMQMPEWSDKEAVF